MNGKKGILMTGTVLIFAFLLSYSAWVLLIDKSPVDEKLKLGEMAKEVYGSNNDADEADYYFAKASKNALIEEFGQKINSGILMENCEILYAQPQCWFNPEKIVKNLEEGMKKRFGDYIKDNKYELLGQDFDIKLSFDGEKIFISGKSKNPVDFSRKSGRESSLRKNIEFLEEINFNFSDFNEVFKEVNENLLCLKESLDKQVKDDIGAVEESKKKPEECLDQKFNNVEKVDGVLALDYELEGILPEKIFEGSMKVDILGFEASKDIAVG